MQTLLVDRAISMSEFKKNPAAVLRQAAGRPVAVLNHNRVAFYLLEPELLELLLEPEQPPQDALSDAQTPTRTPRQVLDRVLSQHKANKE